MIKFGFKQIFAIILIIGLILNLFFVATERLEMFMFWVNVGVLAGVSYLFYKNDKKR